MKGTYKTRAREIIMAYLKEHTEQRSTAKEIFEAVSARAEGINRTTVYRNLDRLCETGEILKFKEANSDSWYYQFSLEHEHCDEHMHAQCSICGRILHLDASFVNAFGLKVMAEYGFSIDPPQTIIMGKCSACRHI